MRKKLGECLIQAGLITEDNDSEEDEEEIKKLFKNSHLYTKDSVKELLERMEWKNKQYRQYVFMSYIFRKHGKHKKAVNDLSFADGTSYKGANALYRIFRFGELPDEYYVLPGESESDKREEALDKCREAHANWRLNSQYDFNRQFDLLHQIEKEKNNNENRERPYYRNTNSIDHERWRAANNIIERAEETKRWEEAYGDNDGF